MDFEIKRIDLRLRTKYPHLETIIFKVIDYRYIIYVENYTDNFAKLSDEFHNEIRFIAAPVSVSDKKPLNYLEVIKHFDDAEIADSFNGLPLTQGDTLDLINFCLPDIPVNYVEGVGPDYFIKIYTDILSDDQKSRLEDFLKKIESRVDYKIISDPTISMKKLEEQRESEERINSDPKTREFMHSLNNPVLNLTPTKREKIIIQSEKEHEQFYFDNIAKIYNGKIKIIDIIKIEPSEVSCFIDYSSFSNINIRNGILLYDKIYLNFPFEQSYKIFLNEQKISQDEFFSLIQRGKLNLVLTQPLHRYDFYFIKEIENINKDTLITRRKINTILIADFINILNQYYIKELNFSSYIYELSSEFSKLSQIDSDSAYSFLSWPFRAVREAFEVLTFNSSKRVSAFGINNVISKFISKKLEKDLELEFMVNSEDVHISHALGSVLFPSFSNSDYSNRPFASIMGNLLNFYSSLSLETIADTVIFKQMMFEKMEMPSIIDIFEVNEFIPVNEVEDFANNFDTTRKLNSLMSYLASLNSNDRTNKISEYNKEIDKLRSKKIKRQTALDIGFTSATDIAGLWIPFLSLGLKIAEKSSDKLNFTKAIKIKLEEIGNKILNKSMDEKNIAYLAKINSVAKFKKQY